MSEIVNLASAAQARASDPAASVFVSANAGTGKTKLLTDRVLRLLLAGAPADSILCVTYTRAAAAEMRNRINKRLGDWAIISAQDLGDDLKKMGIVMPSQDTFKRARSLFAEVLDNDNGPRVETVHSFCQAILHRFPIEAGVAPHAKLADDDEQAQLKLRARNQIISNANEHLARAINLIAELASEDHADNILQTFLDQETRLGEPEILDEVTAHFKTRLLVPDEVIANHRKALALLAVDTTALRAVASVLQSSGVLSHERRGALMNIWLTQTESGQIDKMSCLVDSLFSVDGALSERSLSNKKIREQMPDCVQVQQNVIAHLEPVIIGDMAQKCKEMTLALYRYGVAFWQEYERLKALRGLLDYNDLINHTNRLLIQSDAAQWVAWKLDNGLQHLLIDEAQDTSPPQWHLLLRLAGDFFVGESANNYFTVNKPNMKNLSCPDRSLFAVGDFKQSIYSFQGADPRVMHNNRMELAQKARDAEKVFEDVSLSVSFRSSKPILQLVNAIIPQLDGIEDFVIHDLARDDLNGFVEVWPVITGVENAKTAAVLDQPTMTLVNNAAINAALQLAETIKLWTSQKKLSSGELMGAGDVLILVRKRGVFFEHILKALQQKGIPVAGADRMKLEDQVEIQDLLALGDVMMLPNDDLQLAVVLKSPLCGLSDDELFKLAYNRGTASLFSRLMAHRGGDNKFGKIADQLVGWQVVADRGSVFEFFSHVLVNGGRLKFIRRLGHAINESLDHFLTLAQNMALGDAVSLLQFLAAIRGSGGDVKRDMDSSGSDEVRVMTIHGAKGLEAPIVILPDMLKPRPVNKVLGRDDNVVYWMPPGKAFQPAFIGAAKATSRALEDNEANRLLYVALTRAREGLVIAGWEKSHGVRQLEGSDYELVKTILVDLPGTTEVSDNYFVLESIAERPILDTEDAIKDNSPKQILNTENSDWISAPAPIDASDGKPLRPSQPGLDYVPVARQDEHDGSQSSRNALAYGRLAHQLFEILPLVSASRYHEIARPILKRASELTSETKSHLVERLIKIIGMPQLAPIFDATALAEVPINGMVNNVAVAGQIDRLYVGDDHIILADFKTGKRPKGTPPKVYVEQMALYDALLAQIYSDRPILCWLIWIDTQDIEEISNLQRQKALADLFAI